MAPKEILKSYKSRALALVGLIFLLVGWAQFSTYQELTPQAKLVYQAQLSIFPDLRIWALTFMLSGILAIVTAVTKHYWVGFCGLMLVSSWWASLFLASWLINEYSRTWSSILTWSLISVFLYIIAAWPEFPDPQLIADAKDRVSDVTLELDLLEKLRNEGGDAR